MILHPTGTCFEDTTLEFARMLAADWKLFRDPTFLLCHGICGPNDDVPREYSHAWIEHGQLVHAPCIVDGVFGFIVVELPEFYRAFRVTDVTKYTAGEAWAVAKSQGDVPPPWEEKYRRLCRDYKP